MLNNIECTCSKCHNSLNVNSGEHEIRWFEYSSYSQKKIHCTCGHWNVLHTIEDDSFLLNTDGRYYEYNKCDLRLRRIRKWNDYITYNYDCNFDQYENSYTNREDCNDYYSF